MLPGHTMAVELVQTYVHWLELLNIIALVKSIKCASDNFTIFDSISFNSSSTHSSSSYKLKCSFVVVLTQVTFHTIVCLWNTVPPLNITESMCTLKRCLYQ